MRARRRAPCVRPHRQLSRRAHAATQRASRTGPRGAGLEREVRANLVYRDFTRVGAAKMPDAKTMGRWGVALGPEVIKQIHERMVKIAQANRVTEGRRMRVDTTVVETNVHYPTDSSL